MYIDATRRDATKRCREQRNTRARFFPANIFCNNHDGRWSLCTAWFFFLQETLFPYVRKNLKNYIETKWEAEEFKQDYEKLKEQVNMGFWFQSISL